jgi:hypothetical protein
MTDRVLVGLTGSFINEKVADAAASGFAVDLGVQYDTGWRGLRFGFCMKNVGPNMRYGGPSFEQRLTLPGDDPAAQPHVVRPQAASFELPSYLQMGLTYDFKMGEKRSLTVMGTFQGNNFSTDEYRLGGEFLFSEWLALRAGFTGQFPLSEEDRQQQYLYNWVTAPALIQARRHWSRRLGGNGRGQFFNDNSSYRLRRVLIRRSQRDFVRVDPHGSAPNSFAACWPWRSRRAGGPRPASRVALGIAPGLPRLPGAGVLGQAEVPPGHSLAAATPWSPISPRRLISGATSSSSRPGAS